MTACFCAASCSRNAVGVATSAAEGLTTACMASAGVDERRRWRAARRQREHLVAGVGDEDGVLPLGRQRMVLGDDGPAVVAELLHLLAAGVDHRLDGEGHPGLQFLQRAGPA